MTERHTIPIRPDLGESGIPLAGWTIRIVPNDADVTDSEYDAGLAAIEDWCGIGRALRILRDDPRMRRFTIEME